MTVESQQAALDRLRSKRRRSMGRELGDLHALLSAELSWSYLTWNEFKALYASNPTDVDVLNSTAVGFFALLEQMYYRDLLLGLCRLTDPPQTASKDNLTLMRLSPLVLDAKLQEEVDGLVNSAVDQTKFARVWRNKHLSHHDLSRALDPHLHPLPQAVREDIQQPLITMATVLNALELHFDGSETLYHNTTLKKGARTLITFLHRSLAHLQNEVSQA